MMSLEMYSKKSILPFLTLLASLMLFSACEHKIQTSRKRPDFLPNHAAFILECHNLEKAKANLKNLALIKENEQESAIQFFSKNSIINSFKESNKKFSLCFSPTAKGSYETTYITKDSVFNAYSKSTALEKFKGTSIYQMELENIPFWVSYLGKITIICSNKSFLKASIEQYIKEIDFGDQKLIKSWDKNAIASFYLNLEKTTSPISFLDGFTQKFASKGQLAGDVVINDQDIITNAVYYFSNSLKTSPFKIQRPQQLLEELPVINNFFNLQVQSSEKEVLEEENVLIDQIQSYGILQNDTANVLALHLLNSFEKESLFEVTNDIDSLSIKKLRKPITATDLKVPFESKLDTLKYGFALKNYMLLGSEKSLYQIINTSIQPEMELTYQQLIKHINQDAAYQNFKKTSRFFADLGFSNSLKTTSFPITGLSVNQQRDYTYLQVAIPKKVIKPKVIKKVYTVFETPIFEPIVNGPYLFKNHLTQHNNAVLQTENYKLQLYSNEGKLLWTKALNEPILGAVHEMDIFNNGRLQLTFVTPSKWYILDRNGKDVGNFPKNFKDEITQPLSFFDYDNNKKYRFGITQNNVFNIYNKKGKRVGFNFKNVKEGEIIAPPKHIKIGNKDFIVINEEKGGIHFLGRTGKERINLTKPILSKNQWYQYKNTFSTLSNDHLLTQVSTTGKTGKLKKHPSDDFTKIDATSKTWVSFTGNELYIKNNKVILEYGSYTNPKIFYLRDKIYVSITNQESDTTYLFDSNAKPIKGFPIKGSKVIDMRIDKSKKNIDIVNIDINNSLVFCKLRI